MQDPLTFFTAEFNLKASYGIIQRKKSAQVDWFVRGRYVVRENN
jgi:hypothetical protein